MPPSDADVQAQITADLGTFHDADDAVIVTSGMVTLVWSMLDAGMGQYLLDLRTRQKLLRDSVLPKLAPKVDSDLSGFKQDDSDEYKAALSTLSSLDTAIAEAQRRANQSAGPRVGRMNAQAPLGALPGGPDPNSTVFQGDPRYRRRWGW